MSGASCFWTSKVRRSSGRPEQVVHVAAHRPEKFCGARSGAPRGGEDAARSDQLGDLVDL